MSFFFNPVSYLSYMFDSFAHFDSRVDLQDTMFFHLVVISILVVWVVSVIRIKSSTNKGDVSNKLSKSRLTTPFIVLTSILSILFSLAFLDHVFFADNMGESNTLQPTDNSQGADVPVQSGSNPQPWVRILTSLENIIGGVTVVAIAGAGLGIFAAAAGIGGVTVRALRSAVNEGPSVVVEASSSGVSVGISPSSVTDPTTSKLTSLLDFFSDIDISFLFDSLHFIPGAFLMVLTTVLFWMKTPLLMDSTGTVTRVRLADNNVLGNLIEDHYWFQFFTLLTCFGLILFTLATIYIRFYEVASGALVSRVLSGKWAEKYANTVSKARVMFDMYLPYVLIVGLLQIFMTLWFLFTHPIATIIS